MAHQAALRAMGLPHHDPEGSPPLRLTFSSWSPDTDWSDAVLDFADLSGSHMEGLSFARASFVGTDLSFSSFRECDLSSTWWDRAGTSGTVFDRCVLSGSGWRGEDPPWWPCYACVLGGRREECGYWPRLCLANGAAHAPTASGFMAFSPKTAALLERRVKELCPWENA
jgi:hypothetical protein